MALAWKCAMLQWKQLLCVFATIIVKHWLLTWQLHALSYLYLFWWVWSQICQFCANHAFKQSFQALFAGWYACFACCIHVAQHGFMTKHSSVLAVKRLRAESYEHKTDPYVHPRTNVKYYFYYKPRILQRIKRDGSVVQWHQQLVLLPLSKKVLILIPGLSGQTLLVLPVSVFVFSG